MEITSLTIGLRESALLVGDYSTYRKQLSRKLLAVRKRLGRNTRKGAKYTKKEAVTSDDVKNNHEFLKLSFFAAERAWAHAMYIKSLKSEDTTGQVVTGPVRDHVLTRLTKAVKHAKEVSSLLQDRSASGATDTDVLETQAYQAALLGALEFERQSEGHKTKETLAHKERWHDCLQQWSLARVIYAALLQQSKRDVYKDFINNTINPTLRYAAYQAKLPRTVAIPSIALKFFPGDDQSTVDMVKLIDPEAFTEQKPVTKDREVAAATGAVPTSITWRGRSANLVDASIGQALAQAATAEKALADFLASNTDGRPGKRANAYDDILIAYQDASDADRRATEELEKEGVDEGDSRMQDLRVSSLAINYDLVSWRVGRNRVLIGGAEGDDGRTFEDVQQQRTPKKPRRDGKPWAAKVESRSRKLARLRERAVLYDSTIQSIESIKALRGAVRDSGFVAELDAKAAYFRALKCLNIAVSHDLLGNHLNALALIQRGATLLESISPPKSSRNASAPPTLDIQPSSFAALQEHLASQLVRHQALSELHAIEKANAEAAAQKAKHASAPPLVERIADYYPEPGVQVDLTNLVAYPPKVQPVPVKPLFLDVAFNYLEYPGREKQAVEQKAGGAAKGADTAIDKQEEKKGRGWFGFGR